ncbi:hypothetical protein AKJ49_01200 [candidate division MSBL1 archaeon SCGC-AAA382A03]|uniref:tRNA (guanine(10)-N(2))-dimethyltransferase n=1 Tax=candidate division MSBL1 archaeon SCGC-AAA382A03 TaxID=1698278 RepID=A0A133VFL9_9EURY|nr:hypothetical protein AKJ49_01200 [candidate division MSBL1 archaeon SCGC-AAA382A03]
MQKAIVSEKMKRLAFFLSGEHPTLPVSEVIGAIEAEGFSYEIDEKLDQVLILKTKADPTDISRRLGMCHWIGEHFCTCPSEELMKCIGSSDLVDFLPQSETIAVRVKRIKKYSPRVDTQGLSKKIADKLLEEINYSVDLESPDNEIVCLLTEEKCVLTVIRKRIDREFLNERKPSKRPSVHPSTMQPNLARALVNIARTSKNERFLDPFCGVGGILIEAGLIGANTIGADINSELLQGAEKNLSQLKIKDYDLRICDARELEIEKVDAIATDPPYGRQASTGGSELNELYKSTFPALARFLKSGKYLCITAPSEINLEKLTKNQPFDLEEKHQNQVHKSLTREIYVFKRE